MDIGFMDLFAGLMAFAIIGFSLIVTLEKNRT